MLLIDIGLTLLGGPSLSPASFLTEILGLPREKKQDVADIVFCRIHEAPDQLIDDVEHAFRLCFTPLQRRQLVKYWNAQQDLCRPLPGAEEFCAFILDAGLPYCMASNLWQPFYEAFRYRLPDFARNARRLFLSHRMGIRKPHRIFYDAVFSCPDINPRRTLMVGDSMDNDIRPCLDRGVSAVFLHHGHAGSGNASPALLPEPPAGSVLYVAENHRECARIIRNHFMTDMKTSTAAHESGAARKAP